MLCTLSLPDLTTDSVTTVGYCSEAGAGGGGRWVEYR